PFAHGQFLLEAQAVSQAVAKSLAKNPSSSVAILVRVRSHLVDIANQLKSAKIEFESVEITQLQDNLLTRDLLSLSRALLHLGDKLAWLSILRAPWCGLVLDDLLLLSTDDNSIIFEQLDDANILQKLSKDGQKRAQHLHNCLQDSIKNQGRFTFTELLTHAINQLGLKNESLNAVELSIKNKFLQIIYDCEQQQSLNSETIEAALKNLYAPSDTAQVKLMTIHQAKGLEFDTVIVPGLGRGQRNDDSPIIRLREFSNKSLLLAPIKAAVEQDNNNTYKYLQFIESQQSHFESMRLLYVAMTRARSKLHLLGMVNKSGNIGKKTLLELLAPFFQRNFDDIDSNLAVAEPSETLQLQRFAVLKTPTIEAQIQGEIVEYKQNSKRLFKSALGTLVHQYLQWQLFTPSAENIRSRLIEIGTKPSEIAHYQAHISKLLNNVKNDEKFAWLFKERQSNQNEAQFFFNGKIIIIDKLFVDQNELWVIDFKTAEPAEFETLEAFIQRQQKQHREQLLFYKKAMLDIYQYPVRCALYCPSISQLIEIV
ncbi:MAG: DNA helicase UvrD, partial [Candidatus Thioglobus sp.]